MSYRTTNEVIAARLSPDLLLAVFDAGVGLGLGRAPELAANADIDELIAQIRARWFGEIEAARAWRRATEDAPLIADELPGWLMAADTRETALSDARPPEHWLVKP